MPPSSNHPSPQQDLLAALRSIPPGRVATHRQLAEYLAVSQPRVVALLAELSDAETATTPWWRAVADGGAVGRHPRRDEQIDRLRAEGLLVAPVGIVQNVNACRVTALGLAAARTPPADQPTPAAPSRARGSKGRPTSTI